MTTLAELGAKYGTDKLDHGYLPRYEQHLGAIRHAPFNLLEIGVHRGASLRMWRDYFDQARIFGVDKLAHCQVRGEERIETYCVDVTHAEFAGIYDVVIDDGSHQASEIFDAFTNLWLSLRPGGWYVIEDLETQWLTGWGGDPALGSDAIHRIYRSLDTVLRGRAAPGAGVHELHAYEQIVFIRKAFL